jgi:hypothetical protein
MLFSACNSGKVILDRVYEDFDARFISQVYTWECQAPTNDEVSYFPGTFGHEMVLYYAPGNLDDLLPSEGCVYGLDMFPVSAGSNGSSLEGLVGYPAWSNDSSSGIMEGGFGYWFQDVFTDERTCTNPSDILNEPIALSNALGLSGATIETAFDVPNVHFSSGVTTLGFGENALVEWDQNDWPRRWVHIRRLNDNQPIELLTCTVPSANSFLIDEDIWTFFDSSLPSDNLEILVGFEFREVQKLPSGEIVETLNRAVAVPVEN